MDFGGAGRRECKNVHRYEVERLGECVADSGETMVQDFTGLAPLLERRQA